MIAYKWAVGLDNNLVLVAVVDSLSLLVPRVQLSIPLAPLLLRGRETYLDLVDVWWPGLGILLQLFDMSNAKVADTNRLGSTLLVCFLECGPHELSRSGTSVRAVDEVQINIAAFVNLVYALNNTFVGFFVVVSR